MKIRIRQKINHGRKNKRKQKICHGNKNKQRQRQKHLPRINTEKHGRKAKQKNLPRINTERSHCIQSRKRARRLHSSLSARSKGSNGGVAVGLPHRNYSVFKQTHINQRDVKEKGAGRAPADLHPPLNKKRWLKGI